MATSFVAVLTVVSKDEARTAVNDGPGSCCFAQFCPSSLPSFRVPSWLTPLQPWLRLDIQKLRQREKAEKEMAWVNADGGLFLRGWLGAISIIYIYIVMCIYIYICSPPKTYLLCSRYVPECLVFLLILSPIVALHQESILGACAWTHPAHICSCRIAL